MSLRVIADRATISRQRPVYVERPFQSRQNRRVSSNSASISSREIRRGPCAARLEHDAGGLTGVERVR